MQKSFNLKILTPEKEIYDDFAESVTVTAPDGRYTILADHTPLVMPLVAGTVGIKKEGKWSSSANTEGFIEVSRHGTRIFVQTCESVT